MLVGTISVEKSEALSRMLKAKGIPHNVLNAKQHEREAEIVAQAGRKGAVTIATNMAGRGTDIMLGGNITYMAKAALRKELQKKLSAAKEAEEAARKAAKAAAKAAGQPAPELLPETDTEARLSFLLTEADGHADTDDADILEARRRFDELCAEYEPDVKAEADAVRKPAACSLWVPSATNPAGLTTSCAAVPAVRATRLLPVLPVAGRRPDAHLRR